MLPGNALFKNFLHLFNQCLQQYWKATARYQTSSTLSSHREKRKLQISHFCFFFRFFGCFELVVCNKGSIDKKYDSSCLAHSVENKIKLSFSKVVCLFRNLRLAPKKLIIHNFGRKVRRS